MEREKLARWIVALLALFALSIPLAEPIRKALARQPRIELTARLPENGGWSMQYITVRAGEPVHLRMTSEDVVHSFAIGKSEGEPVDIIPGEFSETILHFEQPGKYTFYCTRWCGANHWRMRGVIEVIGEGPTPTPEARALFLELGIDPDAAHLASMIPAYPVSVERGAQFHALIPPELLSRETYLTHSPEQLWQILRAQSSLTDLTDHQLWDVVAWLWHRQTSADQLTEGQQLYAQNCAACHGETGQGDGVIVRGLPEMNHEQMGQQLVKPPDFTDPTHLIGASPALLEGKIIRGGMGTGMPYWGPIFTSQQIDAVIAYLYQFAWNGRAMPEPGS